MNRSRGLAKLHLSRRRLSILHLPPMVPSPTGFCAPRMEVGGPSRPLSLQFGCGSPWRYKVAVWGIHDILRYLVKDNCRFRLCNFLLENEAALLKILDRRNRGGGGGFPP
ncbi:hypothetical protein ACFE04_003204 [Oxalis oulophora]